MGVDLLRIFLLNYSPGFWKEISVWRETFQKEGWSVSVTANRGFTRRFGTSEFDRPRWSIRRNRTIWLIWNNHPGNIFVAMIARIIGVKLAFACHEPRKDLRGLSVAFRARRLIVNSLQDFLIWISDVVVVPSRNCEDRFRSEYPKYKNAIIQTDLLIPDHGTPSEEPQVRDLVCFPGRPNGSTGHEDFYAMAPELHSRGMELCLLHVNAPQSPDWITPKDLVDSGCLNDAHQLSDADIDNVFRRSVAVLRLDRTSTQSGTIPVAFRAGTPVIVRNHPGLTQYVEEGVNGVILPEHFSENDIVEAVKRIREGDGRFRLGALETFTQRFSASNARQVYFLPLLETLFSN